VFKKFACLVDLKSKSTDQEITLDTTTILYYYLNFLQCTNCLLALL